MKIDDAIILVRIRKSLGSIADMATIIALMIVEEGKTVTIERDNYLGNRVLTCYA